MKKVFEEMEVKDPPVKSMEKKSILERTNSWRPFITEVHGAVTAKDYRKKTVASILHIVDPELSMWPGSFWRYFRGHFIGIGFPSGRETLYKVPFEQFLERKGYVFENAPLQAIQEFNALITALFSPPVAEHFVLNEKLARERRSRIEEAIAKEQKAKKDLTEFAFAFQKELTAPVKEEGRREEEAPVEVRAAPEGPPSLFSAFSPLDQETKERIERILGPLPPKDTEASPQQKYGQQVISLLEKAIRASQLSRQNLLITLTSPRLLSFADLLQRAKAMSAFAPDEAFLTKCFQEPDIEKVGNRINDCLSELERPFSSFIEKAEKRTKLIQEIKREAERLEELMKPFVLKKDLKEQAEILLSQIAIIQIPETLYKETNTESVEKAIKKVEERLNTVSSRVESQFREFILQNRQLSRSAGFLKMLLFAARWELVSGATPYPDLFSTIIRIRDQLLQSVENQRQLLLSGKATLSEYALSIVSVIYETDVRVLRGELTARSLRLKDLRLALLPHLQGLDRMLSLLALSGNVAEKELGYRQWIADFFFKLLSPYKLFKDTYDPESINILFRYWWLDLERFLTGKEARFITFLRSIEESATRLIRPIARTLDTVDKISGGTRQKLYQQFLEVTKEKKGAEAVSTIDQWLRDEAKGLIGSLLPQLSLLPQVDLEPLVERLLHIEERLRDVAHFAKAIQAVKTFEPERIDSLLEVCTIFPFVESFDQPPLIRLQNQVEKIEAAIQRIEEELFLELGLLDKKARLEAGYAITNLLPQTLLKVPSIITSISEHFRTLQQHTDPYVSSIAHFLLEETSQLSASFAEIGFTQEALFPAFQKLTVLLFHREILNNALHPKNFARILLLLTATGQIVQRFRAMEAKGEIAFVGTLIDELDALASSQWNIVAPDMLNKDHIHQMLEKFVVTAQRVITTSGLKERREAHLITGIERVSQELTEDITYDIPRLSFVPGDLGYLWKLSIVPPNL